jgi:hypothetical protein
MFAAGALAWAAVEVMVTSPIALITIAINMAIWETRRGVCPSSFGVSEPREAGSALQPFILFIVRSI